MGSSFSASHILSSKLRLSPRKASWSAANHCKGGVINPKLSGHMIFAFPRVNRVSRQQLLFDAKGRPFFSPTYLLLIQVDVWRHG